VKILVGTRKGLFIYEGEGTDFRMRQHAFVGEPVSALLDDRRDGALYVALNLGHFGCKLHRSSNGGRTFDEVAAPNYPRNDDGVSLELIWVLESAGDDRPGALWCGTIPGGLFESTDRCASWQLNEALWREPARKSWMGGGYDQPGVHSICVDPRNSAWLAVAVSIGGVWYSRDGGASWTASGAGLRADYVPPELAHRPEQQDPHRIVQCAGAPDRFWMQHHNGIWTSTDHLATWQEITSPKPSQFGFAVAVDPRRGERAWFVPADKDERRVPIGGELLVNRTDDGGKSFVQQRAGLPQANAYDLIYRHALDVASDGCTLAFGSTTGNLWVTADGGEQWIALSAHLPPINAVRISES